MNDPMRILTMLFDNEASFLGELDAESKQIIQTVRHMLLIELEEALARWEDSGQQLSSEQVYGRAVRAAKSQLAQHRDMQRYPEALIEEICSEYAREALFAIDAVLERAHGLGKSKKEGS